VIQIGRDIAGDRSITSGDVVQRVGDGLGCHGYDKELDNHDIEKDNKYDYDYEEAVLNN